MNDLLSMAQKAMEGFDPKTDTVDDYEKIPDGDYTCMLEDVTSRSNDKGTKWVAFKYVVLDGDYAERYLFVNYFFTEKMAQRSIRTLSKLAYEFGYQLPVEAFSSYEELASTLNQLAGNQAIVHQSTSKNDFTNFKVTPLAV